jgi:hypothetical protein
MIFPMLLIRIVVMIVRPGERTARWHDGDGSDDKQLPQHDAAPIQHFAQQKTGRMRMVLRRR